MSVDRRGCREQRTHPPLRSSSDPSEIRAFTAQSFVLLTNRLSIFYKLLSPNKVVRPLPNNCLRSQACSGKERPDLRLLHRRAYRLTYRRGFITQRANRSLSLWGRRPLIPLPSPTTTNTTNPSCCSSFMHTAELLFHTCFALRSEWEDVCSWGV